MVKTCVIGDLLLPYLHRLRLSNTFNMVVNDIRIVAMSANVTNNTKCCTLDSTRNGMCLRNFLCTKNIHTQLLKVSIGVTIRSFSSLRVCKQFDFVIERCKPRFYLTPSLPPPPHFLSKQ